MRSCRFARFIRRIGQITRLKRCTQSKLKKLLGKDKVPVAVLGRKLARVGRFLTSQPDIYNSGGVLLLLNTYNELLDKPMQDHFPKVLF